MKNLTAKQTAVINQVVADFESGKVAEICAMATFQIPGDMPSSKWTLSNRWLAMLTTGSLDARTFNQWKKVGRCVNRGERAGMIWRPLIIPVKDEDGNKTDKTKCIGFKPMAVFGVNQTAGDAVDYQEPEVSSELPLLDVAKALGIEVKADWFTGSAYGSCKVDGSAITLNTDSAKVFFHELAHAAHARLTDGKELKGGQVAYQEIVAEFVAEVLRRIVNPDDADTSGNSYRYISHYAADEGWDIGQACVKVLRDAGKIVELILDTAADLDTVGQEVAA